MSLVEHLGLRTASGVLGPKPRRAIVIGAGLAGCEAAYQLAERGVSVELREMKPQKRTPAQVSDSFAELVCSNSLRGAALSNAVGLLKEEMRRAGSIVLRLADEHAVPAGGALAVDRERFSAGIESVMRSHPNIEVIPGEATRIPDADEHPVILATGPLTSDPLAAHLAEIVGSQHLAYYDAIAPVVAADSLQWDKVWKQSRYGKGQSVDPETAMELRAQGREDKDPGDESYVNCPFERDEYDAFVEALCTAEKVEARAFEDVRYFEGCLPCEVMAERGKDTLRYGPMKPVGLVNPHTGRRPWAVVQLRQEDAACTAYNLVGFQTRLKYNEQIRVLRMIPGLGDAEFLRLGSVHRNTFIDAPKLLGPDLQLKARSGVYLAGQITGVEGYVESAACGFLTGLFVAQALLGLPRTPPPPTTALGGILAQLARTQGPYQPSNITWAHVVPFDDDRRKLKKRDKYQAMAERALADFAGWSLTLPTPPSP